MDTVEPKAAEHVRDDFPYYNGRPLEIHGWQWWLVMLGVAIGFGSLMLPINFFTTDVGQFIPAIAFFAIPLVALAFVTPGHWTAIFRPIGWSGVMWMVLIAVLNLVVSLGVGLIVMKLSGAENNPIFDTLAAQDTASRA